MWAGSPLRTLLFHCISVAIGRSGKSSMPCVDAAGSSEGRMEKTRSGPVVGLIGFTVGNVQLEFPPVRAAELSASRPCGNLALGNLALTIGLRNCVLDLSVSKASSTANLW